MLIYLCDGASKGNPGPSSIGVVIWKRVAGTSSARRFSPVKRISKDIGIATNNDAEWQAVLEALEHAKREATKGEFIYIYSDSLLVVEQAKGTWKIKQASMKAYYNKMSELSLDLSEKGIDNIEIAWLPRQLTYLADKQAEKGVRL